MVRIQRTSFIAVFLQLASIAHAQGAVQKYPGLRERADSCIIARVGAEYFREHFAYLGLKPYPTDSPLGDQRIAFYAHHISVGNYSQNVEAAVVLTYADGEWRNGQVEDLPDCVSNESKCLPFHTTKEEALTLAYDAGAFTGAVRYKVSINYNREIDSYVWEITTYQTAANGKSAEVSLSANQLLTTPINAWITLHTAEEFDSVYHRDLEKAIDFRPQRTH